MRKPTVLTILTGVFLVLMSTLIIDGGLPQIKMALNNGYMPSDPVPFKVMLLGCLGLAMVFRLTYPAGTVPPFLASTTTLKLGLVCFSSYLAIHLIVSFLFLKKPLFFLLFSYVDSLFFLFLLIPVLAAVRPLVPWRVVLGVLCVLTVPLCLLGLYQFIMADTVLPTLSADMGFRVYGWAYFGRVRAFSVFGSGLKFAYFLSLVSSMLLAVLYLRQPKGIMKLLTGGLLFLAMVSCAATLTRNGYITMAFSLVAVYLLAKRPSRNHVWLPAIYLALAFAAALAGSVLSILKTAGGQGSISSSESLGQRIDLWGMHLRTWLQTDLATIFFGTGLTQSRRFAGDGEVVLDNVFLAMGYQLGMFGLILFMVCYVSVWRFLFEGYLKDPHNPVRLGLVAVWATFLSSGVFNTSQNFYLHLVPLGAALMMDRTLTARAKVPIQPLPTPAELLRQRRRVALQPQGAKP